MLVFSVPVNKKLLFGLLSCLLIVTYIHHFVIVISDNLLSVLC